MKRLLVILHVYYHYQVDYFIGKLGNISGCRWDLLVTYSSYSPETERKLRAFRPDARFLEVENVGYDVWPFIKAVKQTDMSGYELVLKLHTKGPLKKKDMINRVDLSGFRWRDMLVDSLIGSERKFLRCMDVFEKRPSVGMVCSYELLKKTDGYLPEDTVYLKEEAERIGMGDPKGLFCAGTMFLLRTAVLDKIRRAELTPDMWGGQASSNSTGSLAHVYERLFCMAVYDAGYAVKASAFSALTAIRAFLYKVLHI